MTYQYSAHEQLEEDWRNGRLTPPDEISEYLSPHVEELARRISAGHRLIPIQGRVSDYKSWLAADLARALSETGLSVTIFAPQRANRESSTEKLEMFGADYIEHPGRIDLCNWGPWRDNVGHVDKTTCSSIGCPYYLQNEEDIAERSADGLSSHRMVEAGTRLDAEAMRNIGSREQQDFCPAQFHNEVRASDALSEAVNTATYAKAFEDAAVSPDDPLNSDVLLMDEAHTIAAEPDAVTDSLEPESLLGSLSTLIGTLEDSPERWADRALDDIEGLRDAASHWLEHSSEGRADPDDIFTGRTVDLGDAFNVLDRVEGRLQQNMRRAASRNDWSAAKDRAEPYHAVQAVRAFLSNVKSYRDGDADFVHSLYEQQGELVNEMAFRSVDESVDPLGGTTPGAVFEEWQERGTHPAIAERWGPLLDRHIESLWDGRSVLVGDAERTMPGAPVRPMDRLEEITGSSTTITLSATHNELSDPTRGPDTLRPTRHKLLAAPVYLRASGSERRDYDGARSVSPDTPWFVEMVTRAKETSGDSLAAVPINFRNREKWKAMPVEPLEPGGEEMAGVVPHSRGSIGAKDLESMDIDCVLCGVQVQSPAPTARRLVQWWEMLAPRYDDPGDVLEDSWRLLAQHAVSGTIQAGGRFDWDASNFVFERPGLLELAGFEHEVAGPGSPGFAGEFCRLWEDVDGEWADRRDANRAARVVAYLNKQDRKTATGSQVVGTYQRWYGDDGETARRALWLATDRGRVEANNAEDNTTYHKT